MWGSMKAGRNDVLLIGKVTWSKLYDFGSNPYTSLSLRVQSNNLTTFVKVNITTNQYSYPRNKELIDNILANKGIGIAIFASVVDKDNQLILKSGISDIGIIKNYSNQAQNAVILSGYIAELDPFTIRIPYRNPLKDNSETLYRVIPIKLNSNYSLNKGDTVLISGSLYLDTITINEKTVDTLKVTCNTLLKVE